MRSRTRIERFSQSCICFVHALRIFRLICCFPFYSILLRSQSLQCVILSSQSIVTHAQLRANTADDDLLTGLRGKDVLLVFVESYGRTALDVPVIESALEAGTRRLQKAGFSSRSGFLGSPTFGGLSWLGSHHPAVWSVGGQPAAV